MDYKRLGSTCEKTVIGDKVTIIRTKCGDGTAQLHIRLSYHGAYGMGEKFDHLNQIGQTVENQVIEKFCNQGNLTYLPVPFFVTDTGFGLAIDTFEKTIFTFGEDILCTLPEEAEVITFSGTIPDIIRSYTEVFGEVKLPPKYAFGVWASANHWDCQKKVQEQLVHMENYRFPVSVMVLEAWSDETTFYIWNGASYTPKEGGAAIAYEEFDFSGSRQWPDPKAMIEDLHDKGIRLVLWQIPVYKRQEMGTVPNQQAQWDQVNAIRNKLCVFYQDGTPYGIPQGNWFEGSLIPDFTKQETVTNWFAKRQYLLDMGVDGFKTDGGEFIYRDDVKLSDGKSGKEAKNAYAQTYTGAYTLFLEQSQEKEGQPGDGKVLFSRAGYQGAHTTPIHWAGDQQSTQAELYHVLTAGLSAAMSGIPFWGYDLAGFAGPLPTADLYLRSTQMAVFMPVMQWHSEPTGGQFGGEGEEVNNERSPWNIAQTYGIPGYLEEIRFWHYLRWQLLPYLYSTALDCRDNREPMIRPLVYDYGHDPQSLACTDEYCLGKSLLVAPLMHEGEKTRTVYFPDGKWYGLFSGISYVGRREEISAKEEKFPVYLKEGTGIAMHLGTNRLLGSDIDNQVFGITSLHFILAGWEGRYAFRDEIGSITISWHGNEVTVSCNDRIEGTNTMFLSDEARAEISLGTIKYYISWEQMR